MGSNDKNFSLTFPLGMGGGSSLSSGSSTSASSLSVSSGSFQLSSTAGSLHHLFLAWSSRFLSRSLLKDYSAADHVDRFLSSVPSGPLDTSRSSFSSRCSSYTLSSSGSAPLQLSDSSRLGSSTSSFRSRQVRSRSPRSVRGPDLNEVEGQHR